MTESESAVVVGERLRALRRERGLSLTQVASQIGISASFLSQVETGKVHPSVASLLSIANLLGVSLDDLFDRAAAEPLGRTQEPLEAPPREPDIEDAVIRADDAKSIELETGVMWSRLSDGGGVRATSLLVTYEPGGRDTVDGRLKRHAAWEFGYLIEGALQLKLDFDVIELRPGDSFYFDSDRPHLFQNLGSVPARGIWFVLHKHDAVVADRDGVGGRGAPVPR